VQQPFQVQIQQHPFQPQQQQQQRWTPARLNVHIPSIYTDDWQLIRVDWRIGTLVEYVTRREGGCHIRCGGVTGWVSRGPTFAM
jgi:hypothetical protein